MYILDEESKVSAGVRKGNENPHANLNQSKNWDQIAAIGQSNLPILEWKIRNWANSEFLIFFQFLTTYIYLTSPNWCICL